MVEEPVRVPVESRVRVLALVRAIATVWVTVAVAVLVRVTVLVRAAGAFAASTLAQHLGNILTGMAFARSVCDARHAAVADASLPQEPTNPPTGSWATVTAPRPTSLLDVCSEWRRVLLMVRGEVKPLTCVASQRDVTHTKVNETHSKLNSL